MWLTLLYGPGSWPRSVGLRDHSPLPGASSDPPTPQPRVSHPFPSKHIRQSPVGMGWGRRHSRRGAWQHQPGARGRSACWLLQKAGPASEGSPQRNTQVRWGRTHQVEVARGSGARADPEAPAPALSGGPAAPSRCGTCPAHLAPSSVATGPSALAQGCRSWGPPRAISPRGKRGHL